MDDLISRQYAIDVLNIGAELLSRILDNTYIVGDERAKSEWKLELIESYISDIKDLPSAERKGKWIRKDDEQCYWYECSECGHCPPKDTFKQEWLSHFCPNCGARMVRGEEDG